MAITLTAEDVRDLETGHTINVITEDGTEVVLGPENAGDYALETATGPYTPSKAKTFTTEQLNTAANRAANEILEAIDAPEEGVRDALNLQVNATAYFLEHPDATLADAITANYSERPETVLAWAAS
jgi:hypothetical protein